MTTGVQKSSPSSSGTNHGSPSINSSTPLSREAWDPIFTPSPSPPVRRLEGRNPVGRQLDSSTGVRRLGFGVSGPHGSPLVSAQATEDMIRRAFELGIRLFDTGPSYGNGEAERRLGAALQYLPRYECIISTK